MDRSLVIPKKNRGSLTPSIAILLIFTITISAILSDYARVFSSKPIIENQIVSAIDTALMTYDKTLFNEFSIYGFDKNENITSNVKDALNLFGEGDTNRMYQYEITNIDVTVKDSGLSNAKMLKHLIIENHSRAFVADQVVGWLERIEMFKSLDKLADIVDNYAKMLEGIQVLEKNYRRLKEGYQDFLEFKTLLDRIDISDKVDEILECREKLEEIQDEINDLIEDKEASIGEKLSGIISELKDLRHEKHQIKDDIKDIKKELKELENSAKKVNAYLGNLKDFSSELSLVIGDVTKYNQKLRHLLSDADNKFLKETMVSLSGQVDIVAKHLNEFNDAFSDSISKCNHLSAKITDFITSIRKIIDGAENFDINQSELSDLADALPEIIFDYFEKPLCEDDSGINLLWDLIFSSVAGGLGYDFGTIDGTTYSCLPSRLSATSEDTKFFIPDANETSKVGQLTKKLSSASDFLNNIVKGLANSGDELLQTMVIADYIVTTFGNQTEPTNGDHDTVLKGAEVEYILHGHANGNENTMITDGQIFAIRLALNAISIAAFKHKEIDGISAAISAITGGLAYPVIYIIVLIAWSGGESFVDLLTLKKGGDITFFKFAKDIQFSLEKVISDKSFDMTSFMPKEITKSDDITKFDYKEHLFLLLLFQDEDVQLKRIMDVIALSKSQKDSTFSNYKTEITVDVTYKVKSWFGTPLKTFSCSYKRGY